MSALGAFTFVLHSHLPYLRFGGRWYHAEEWIHDTLIDTYIPLLDLLYDLKDEGVPYKLALGLSPLLAEQLADPLVIQHFSPYIDEQIAAAEKDMHYFESEAYDEHLRFLAEWYRDRFRHIKQAFDQRFQHNLIGAFRRLQDEGYIEIITTAATHAYLPLLARDGSINAQIKTAIKSYQRLFGRAPQSFWLPDYGYRPARITETGRERPGIEQWLAANGITNFIADTHTITRGHPVGVASGEVIGVYGSIPKLYTLPANAYFYEDPRDVSTFTPYFVHEAGSEPDVDDQASVAVIGRNKRLGLQVWGSDLGYQRDFDYRGYHRRAGTSGLRYWRVTGENVDPINRDTYHPDWAAYKIEQHAEHFAHLVGDQLRRYNHSSNGEYGLVTASFTGELFGRWWFEGVAWLGKVLRHLAHNPDIDLTTPGRFVAQHPPTQSLDLPESSWGTGGVHFLWNNEENHWMWSPIHAAEERMERLADHFTAPTDAERVVLAQAARELLLVQSSDWEFLVTSDEARAYAIRRFSQHLDRFEWLAESLEEGQPDANAARAWYEQDKVFADIDYRWFSTKQSAEQ